MTARKEYDGPRGRRQPNKKRLAEARLALANRPSAPEINALPTDVLQEIVDGLVADLRFTQAKVNGLTIDNFWRDTMVGRIPNEWVRLRDEYRDKIAMLMTKMVSLGIADRAVAVQEAQMAMVATMVQEALRRAGADDMLIRRTGEELRQIAIEGQAKDVT